MSGRELTLLVVRRCAVLVVILFALSFVVFSLLTLAPGDTVSILLGTRPRTPETVRLLRHEYHLDQPFFTQYWIWLRHALDLDFGISPQARTPVSDAIGERLPTSLLLGVYAYLLTMILGVGLGVLAALRRGRLADRAIVAGAVVGLCTPAFVVSVLLIYLFSVEWHWFPAFGKGGDLPDQVWHLTLPALALALVSAAFVLRHTRAAVVAVLDNDYVTFARARGLGAGRILVTYVLRNALIPIVTISGIMLAFLITGAVLVENAFSLPGIGQLLVQAATSKDVPMIQGIALLMAVVIVGCNLLIDVVYVLVDPRVRLRDRA